MVYARPVTRRPRLRGIGAALIAFLLVACGGSTPAPVVATPEPTVAEPPADAIRRDDKDVLAEVVAAVRASGRVCDPLPKEEGVVVCDRKKMGSPPVVITYNQPELFYISHFQRKPEMSCLKLAPALNKLNVDVDWVKTVCHEERVTFVAAIHVSSYGLSPADVANTVQRYQDLVRLMLNNGGLIKHLK